ncbi:MAG TPA: oligoendopeptidase F family protein, partial [Alicyclobacillus sp.]|nr:oligoendopeptidase F family protein [Alicyclobacillus sp.]
GSSDYPLEVLAKAGVDMRSPEPVRQALQVFEETVAELEKSFAGS